jgi:putative molybdenum carrier protein
MTMAQWIPAAVISGGQTGADRGGLEAAIAFGLKVGGYVPKGRRAEDGRVPDRYPMWELVDAGYNVRTRLNVVEADATVNFTYGPPTGGTRSTVDACVQLQKPHVVIDLSDSMEANLWKFRSWLNATTPKVLNVAGPRESKIRGMEATVKAFLIQAFTASASSSSTTTR